ncbi:MAG TPA: STAS domain-containing protein [Stellaceae bacterium]|jgi:anti-anti-sigma factor|nr:STAS domain-containing protein [Stellaceae bacterium]
MELQIEELPGNVRLAIPIGRWDVKGASEIDLRLSAVAGSGHPMIIDMSQVNYISSMGIRTIVMSAKATALKGGKLALLAPQPHVEEALRTAGIERILPICDDLEAATVATTP